MIKAGIESMQSILSTLDDLCVDAGIKAQQAQFTNRPNSCPITLELSSKARDGRNHWLGSRKSGPA